MRRLVRVTPLLVLLMVAPELANGFTASSFLEQTRRTKNHGAKPNRRTTLLHLDRNYFDQFNDGDDNSQAPKKNVQKENPKMNPNFDQGEGGSYLNAMSKPTGPTIDWSKMKGSSSSTAGSSAGGTPPPPLQKGSAAGSSPFSSSSGGIPAFGSGPKQQSSSSSGGGMPAFGSGPKQQSSSSSGGMPAFGSGGPKQQSSSSSSGMPAFGSGGPKQQSSSSSNGMPAFGSGGPKQQASSSGGGMPAFGSGWPKQRASSSNGGMPAFGSGAKAPKQQSSSTGGGMSAFGSSPKQPLRGQQQPKMNDNFDQGSQGASRSTALPQQQQQIMPPPPSRASSGPARATSSNGMNRVDFPSSGSQQRTPSSGLQQRAPSTAATAKYEMNRVDFPSGPAPVAAPSTARGGNNGASRVGFPTTSGSSPSSGSQQRIFPATAPKSSSYGTSRSDFPSAGSQQPRVSPAPRTGSNYGAGRVDFQMDNPRPPAPKKVFDQAKRPQVNPTPEGESYSGYSGSIDDRVSGMFSDSPGPAPKGSFAKQTAAGTQPPRFGSTSGPAPRSTPSKDSFAKQTQAGAQPPRFGSAPPSGDNKSSSSSISATGTPKQPLRGQQPKMNEHFDQGAGGSYLSGMNSSGPATDWSKMKSASPSNPQSPPAASPVRGSTFPPPRAGESARKLSMAEKAEINPIFKGEAYMSGLSGDDRSIASDSTKVGAGSSRTSSPPSMSPASRETDMKESGFMFGEEQEKVIQNPEKKGIKDSLASTFGSFKNSEKKDVKDSLGNVFDSFKKPEGAAKSSDTSRSSGSPFEAGSTGSSKLPSSSSEKKDVKDSLGNVFGSFKKPEGAAKSSDTSRSSGSPFGAGSAGSSKLPSSSSEKKDVKDSLGNVFGSFKKPEGAAKSSDTSRSSGSPFGAGSTGSSKLPSSSSEKKDVKDSLGNVFGSFKKPEGAAKSSDTSRSSGSPFGAGSAGSSKLPSSSSEKKDVKDSLGNVFGSFKKPEGAAKSSDTSRSSGSPFGAGSAGSSKLPSSSAAKKDTEESLGNVFGSFKKPSTSAATQGTFSSKNPSTPEKEKKGPLADVFSFFNKFDGSDKSSRSVKKPEKPSARETMKSSPFKSDIASRSSESKNVTPRMASNFNEPPAPRRPEPPKPPTRTFSARTEMSRPLKEASVEQKISSSVSSALASARSIESDKSTYATTRESLRDSKARARARLSRTAAEREKATEKIASLKARMEAETRKVEKALEDVLSETQGLIEEEVERITGLLGAEVILEAEREDLVEGLTSSLKDSIAASESENLRDTEIIEGMLDVRAKIKEGRQASQLDVLISQKKEALIIQDGILRDLNEGLRELTSVLEDSRQRRTRTEEAMRKISEMGGRGDSQFEWSDVEEMERVLERAAESSAAAAKRIRVLSQKIGDALTRKSRILGEPVPVGLAANTRIASVASPAVSRTNAGFDELRSRDTGDVVGVLTGSLGKSLVSVSKLGVFGVKALVDSAQSKDVTDAITGGESMNAGSSYFQNLNKSESSRKASAALRETSDDLLSSLNAIAALSVKAFDAGLRKIEDLSEEYFEKEMSSKRLNSVSDMFKSREWNDDDDDDKNGGRGDASNFNW